MKMYLLGPAFECHKFVGMQNLDYLKMRRCVIVVIPQLVQTHAF